MTRGAAVLAGSRPPIWLGILTAVGAVAAITGLIFPVRGIAPAVSTGVSAGSRPEGEEAEQLKALGKLASVLGAHLLVEEGDGIVTVTKRVAEERGTTYVLIGPSSGGRGPLGRLRDPLPMQLLDALPGVDLRVVADRTLRNGNGRKETR